MNSCEKDNINITVFTPAYNRAYTLERLYNSLLLQRDVTFEWLIIDDGSTDNTAEVVEKFKKENLIVINYHYVKNGGKHRAINLGARFAEGELFFIVDSDDMLTKDSLTKVYKYYKSILEIDDFIGVAGLVANLNNEVIGTMSGFDYLDTDMLSYREVFKYKGDRAEVFVTGKFKDFPFPEYENEKFCPEALVWNRISQKYKMRYFNEIIYQCEYLDDGLTASIFKVRKDSPIATLMHYSELSSYSISLFSKIRAAVNFWRFSFYTNHSLFNKVKMIGFWKSLISFVPGSIAYILDFKKR